MLVSLVTTLPPDPGVCPALPAGAAGVCLCHCFPVGGTFLEPPVLVHQSLGPLTSGCESDSRESQGGQRCPRRAWVTHSTVTQVHRASGTAAPGDSSPTDRGHCARLPSLWAWWVSRQREKPCERP